MIETKPLEVIDFTGGITDYFIDGQPNEAERIDNLFITPNKKPRTRWGSNLFINEQIPLGLFRVNYLRFLEDKLITFAQRRAYVDNSGSFLELLGPDGSSPVFNLGDTNSVISSDEWQGHLFLANDAFSSIQKIFLDGSGNFQVRNAGLPDVNTTGISVVPAAGAGFSYLYGFNYKYTYKVGDVTFIDRGPIFFTDTIEGPEIGANSYTVNLSTSLTANENWDVSNIEIEISRTTNGGTDYFILTSVALGTTTYIDNTTDDALADLEALYTNDGSQPNSAPPKAKFVHVVNDTGYYGFIKDGTSDEAYQVKQSIPGDPDSVPANFVAYTEQKIKGVSSIFDRPLVFCEHYIYRIDNIIDSTGAGNMDLRRIDDRAGCAGVNSIIQTHKGIFWAGDVGFYWSDGFKVRKISDNINRTYEAFVLNEERRKRISATYEPSNDRIIWSVSKEDGANEPDMCIVLDLKWEQNLIAGRGCFTTMSSGDFFRPTALAVNDNKIYRGDTRGYVLVHDDSVFTDPKIDPTVAVANWEKLTIIHDYKSCFLDFGTKFVRKFVPRILVSAANTTNLSLAIFSSNDNNRVTGELKRIRYNSNITWGDELPLFGDANAQWNYQGLIEQWRRFPAKGLRCQYKQVQLTNALVDIVDSELLGQVSVNATAKTATLGGSFQWINDIVDYFISFSSDNFTQDYLITARTPTTLTFQDADNSSTDGSFTFVVKGKPKGEVLELNGYVFHWQFLSKTQAAFGAGGS